MMRTWPLLVICSLACVPPRAQAQLATWRAGAAGGLAFSPDGRRLAAGGSFPAKARPTTIAEALTPSDGLLKVWDVSTGKEVFHSVDPEKVPTCLAYSPGSELLAVGYRGKDPSTPPDKQWPLIVWDIARGKKAFLLPGAYAYDALAFSADGKLLAAASSSIAAAVSPAVTVWDIPSGEKRHHWALSREELATVWAISFSPDGKHVALGGRARDGKSKGRVRVLDVDSGRMVAEFAGFGDWVHSAVFSPDGKCLAVGVGEHDPRALVYAWPAKKLLFSQKVHSHGVWAVGFSGDSRILVTGGLERDRQNVGGGTWKSWRIATGELLHTQAAHEAPVVRLAVSRGGSLLATGSINEVKIWNMPK